MINVWYLLHSFQKYHNTVLKIGRYRTFLVVGLEYHMQNHLVSLYVDLTLMCLYSSLQ